MLFLSIHPPYISWFYYYQSNFFRGIISQLKVSSKKGKTNRTSWRDLLIMGGGRETRLLFSKQSVGLQQKKNGDGGVSHLCTSVLS